MTPITLIPYRLLAAVVAVLLTFLAVFALGWTYGEDHVQESWNQAKADQTAAWQKAELDARAKEQSMNQKLQEAQNAATERENKLRADYAAAHDAANGLRDTINALRGRLSATTADACVATAGSSLAVLGECADRYRAVAEAADGCFSDRQALIEAWPK